jgi:hypothetical protein
MERLDLARAAGWFSYVKRRHVERGYPYFLAGLGGVIWWALGVCFPVNQLILVGSLTIAAVLTGFLSTALAMLIGLNSPVMQQLRRTSFIGLLAAYVREAMIGNVLFGSIALSGLFQEQHGLLFGTLWISALLLAVLCFVRILDILIGLLQQAPE